MIFPPCHMMHHILLYYTQKISQTVHSAVFGPKELIGENPAWIGEKNVVK